MHFSYFFNFNKKTCKLLTHKLICKSLGGDTLFLTDKERDLSDEEWEQITDTHRHQFYLYLEEFIMPEILAHYIATGYYQNAIYEESFDLHITTNLSIVNYAFENINLIKSKVKDILRIKYFLLVVQEEPVLIVKEL